MMGRRKQGQGQLFYEFRLDEAIPDDHLVRKIRAVLDLSWVHAELRPYYSEVGRPSIDPVLMIQMLIIGYVFAIRSERQIAGRFKSTSPIDGSVTWVWKTLSLTTPPSPGPAMSASARAVYFGVCSSAS
jgi:transposase